MRVGTAEAVVSIVVPCLDEETAIGGLVTGLLAQGLDEVVVVDGGSCDRTAEVARSAGALVIVEPRRGYGRACSTGVAAARPDATIVAFIDGDGSDDPVLRARHHRSRDWGRGRFLYRVTDPRDPPAGEPHAAASRGGTSRWRAAAGHLRGSVQRHGALSRDPSRDLAGSRHGGGDLRLEPRDADAGGGAGSSGSRGSGRLPEADRRCVESVGQRSNDAARRLEPGTDLRPPRDPVAEHAGQVMARPTMPSPKPSRTETTCRRIQASAPSARPAEITAKVPHRKIRNM